MVDATQFKPYKTSPLQQCELQKGAVELMERAHLGKVTLRGDAEDDAFAHAVSEVLGVSLPNAVGGVSESGDVVVFWQGPNEWLIHCPEDTAGEWIARLAGATEGKHSALVDVTNYYTVIRLSGEKAREVLAKGSPFDTHPSVFPVGQCAQTRFAKASIVLHHIDASPTYDIQVRCSHATYLWDYLSTGAREYNA